MVGLHRLVIKTCLISKKVLTNSSLDEFKKLPNPSIEQYSERSLLLKPGGKSTKKKLKEIKQDWAILNFDELPELYWNDTLEGWVSSRDNESALVKNLLLM